MPKTSFAGHTIRLPNHPAIRVLLGILLIIGGLLGFLPILDFWMIPLGLVILSVDIPVVRRLRRRSTVRLGFWLKSRFPRLAQLLGFTVETATGRK